MRLHRHWPRPRRISEKVRSHARTFLFETACAAVEPGVAKDRNNGHTSITT